MSIVFLHFAQIGPGLFGAFKNVPKRPGPNGTIIYFTFTPIIPPKIPPIIPIKIIMAEIKLSEKSELTALDII